MSAYRDAARIEPDPPPSKLDAADIELDEVPPAAVRLETPSPLERRVAFIAGLVMFVFLIGFSVALVLER